MGQKYDREVQEYAVDWHTCEYTCRHSSYQEEMLASAGGSVVLTKDWAHYPLQRMGYVKWKATTKAKNTVEDFDTVKSNFFCLISRWWWKKFFLELIINLYQTGLKYVRLDIRDPKVLQYLD